MLTIPDSMQAQIQKPFAGEIRFTSERYHDLVSHDPEWSVGLWQPLGVSNLICAELTLQGVSHSSYLRGGYSFTRMPGYRNHSGFVEAGRQISPVVYVFQGLGFGLHESFIDHPIAWFIQMSNLIWLRIDEGPDLVIQAANWIQLFWPSSRKMAPFHLTITGVQPISADCHLVLALRSGIQEAVNFGGAFSLDLPDNQNVFVSLSIVPFGFGLGYGFTYEQIRISFFVEHARIFGLSPYTQFQWDIRQ